MGIHRTDLGKVIEETLASHSEMRAKEDIFINNLKTLQYDYDVDDWIIYLWNKGYNRNQIRHQIGISFGAVDRHIDKLIKLKRISDRGRG